MSTHKKTGETFEHVSAHFYFSKTYKMKKKVLNKHLGPTAEYSRGNKHRCYTSLWTVGSRNLSRGRPQKRAPPVKPATKKTSSTISPEIVNAPETAYTQLKWHVEDTCFVEVLRALDGHTLLPPGLFGEVSVCKAQL